MRHPAAVLLVAALAGCHPNPLDLPTEPAPPPASDPGVRFDPSATGTVTGRVTWTGDVPNVPALDVAIRSGLAPNPFAPAVDPTTRGLAGAVVFVRNLDPALGKPWDLPPVRVEITDAAIRLIPENGPSGRVGFVRRGAEVPMASAEAGNRMLRARGAAFFTLAFPEPNQPLTRTFDRPGLVTFTSGSGEFWAAADLFVCEHPYHAITGPDGSFSLPRVPAGSHELGVWVRDWHVVGRDRDPENGLISRLRFADPVEKRTTVRVEPGATATAGVSLSAGEFGPR